LDQLTERATAGFAGRQWRMDNATAIDSPRAGLARLCFIFTILWFGLGTTIPAAAGNDVNPFLGQSDAIEKGDEIYRSHCVICHKSAGGRGPNLFRTKLSSERFADVVINGRLGARGQMPALGLRLSIEDVWQVEAFVKSRDHL